MFGPTMKLNMFKRLSVILLVTSCFSAAFGQTSVTKTSTISIGVAEALTLYVNRNLSFGTVVAGTGTKTVVANSAGAAKLTVSGHKNRNVYVTLTPPAFLSDGTDRITYSASASYNSSADDPSTSTAWASASGRQAAMQLSANSRGSTAEAFIYLYGSIDVGNVPAGNYSGTYVVSVSY